MNRFFVMALSILLCNYQSVFAMDDDGVKGVSIELPRFASPVVYRDANQQEREFSCCLGSEENVKCCAVVTVAASVCVVMPILLGCLLPTCTLHVNNTTKYPITVSCPGSINSLQAHSHGRLRCSSSLNGDNVYGYTPWNSGIKGDYASGHVVKEGGRSGNIFDLTVTPCKHECSQTSQSCSGSGKSRHCSSSTTYYDETVTWTAVVPAPTNTTAAVTRHLRGWNGLDSEYISDIAGKR